MNRHLSTQQFVDATEGRTPPALAAHLRECPTCAARLAELEAVVSGVREAGRIPEPSPLFWDHFSARVRAAVDAAPPDAPAWWPRWWRQIVAFGAMAAVAMVVVLLRSPSGAPAPTASTASAGRITAAGPTASDAAVDPDDEPWNLIVALAGSLPHDDLHELVPPTHGTAGLIEDLTPEERQAFVQLVRAEMQQKGGTE